MGSGLPVELQNRDRAKADRVRGHEEKGNALPVAGEASGIGAVEVAKDHRVGPGLFDQLGKKRGFAAGAQGG